MKPGDDRQRQEVGEPAELQESDGHDDNPSDDGRRGDQFHVLVEDAGARRRGRRRRGGAIVESAPTETMGLDPMKKNTNVAVMKAIIAVKAGTPASCDVASCSGIAIAKSVMPARNWLEKFRAREPDGRSG